LLKKGLRDDVLADVLLCRDVDRARRPDAVNALAAEA